MQHCWPQHQGSFTACSGSSATGNGELVCATAFLLLFHDAVIEGCLCCQNWGPAMGAVSLSRWRERANEGTSAHAS